MKVAAIGLYLLLTVAGICMNVTVDGRRIESPLIRALIVPPIFIIAGICLLVVGIAFASPLLLFLLG